MRHVVFGELGDGGAAAQLYTAVSAAWCIKSGLPPRLDSPRSQRDFIRRRTIPGIHCRTARVSSSSLTAVTRVQRVARNSSPIGARQVAPPVTTLACTTREVRQTIPRPRALAASRTLPRGTRANVGLHAAVPGVGQRATVDRFRCATRRFRGAAPASASTPRTWQRGREMRTRPRTQRRARPVRRLAVLVASCVSATASGQGAKQPPSHRGRPRR